MLIDMQVQIECSSPNSFLIRQHLYSKFLDLTWLNVLQLFIFMLSSIYFKAWHWIKLKKKEIEGN